MVEEYLLQPEEMVGECSYDELPVFKTTEDLHPLEGIIGQKRAVKAMQFGLCIKQLGFNIFMAGIAGTGKLTYACSIVKEQAQREEVPDDWCYVYNFKKTDSPSALRFKAGEGRIFQEKIRGLVEELKDVLKKVFESEDYERQKAELLKKYQNRRTEIFRELEEIAKKEDFSLQMKSTGIVAVPIIEGELINREEYEKLDSQLKDQIQERHNRVQEAIAEATRKNQRLDKEAKSELKKMDQRVANYAAGHHIQDLKDSYQENQEVLRYLDSIQEDFIENLEYVKEEDEQEAGMALLGKQKRGDDYLKKYQVNLLIDNSHLEGAPVIVENNPTYYNLVGKMEYENKMGTVTTDFTMIKPGALHQANGGYLILQAKDLLSHLQSWEALKRTLKNRQVKIENIGEQYSLFPVATLKPEAIPLQVKVILIGNPYIYQILYHYDEDFRKLFKIKADFDTEMERSRENVEKMVSFINTHCKKSNLLHFTQSAVSRLVEHSSRLAGHQEKLTTCFNDLVEIIYEAVTWAQLEKREYVEESHVLKAIEERIYRSSQYEDKIQELFKDGTLLLDVEDRVVGQVNGLSVLNVGDYSFGKPSRITAAVKIGNEGVIHIERETKLSGKIHNKGVMILSGYLGWRYGEDFPLSLSASITFEQLYEGVEGDSASSTELYALLSSIARIPLKQSLAVTGSVNQKGEIQAVGGVSEKVEGFFKVCRYRGLTGHQGVIIPRGNKKNLNLSAEVVEAVREGLFKIYAISHIDEGLEILTGRPAGKRDEDGHFPEASVNDLVATRLREMAEELTHFGELDEDEGEREEKENEEKS